MNELSYFSVSRSEYCPGSFEGSEKNKKTARNPAEETQYNLLLAKYHFKTKSLSTFIADQKARVSRSTSQFPSLAPSDFKKDTFCDSSSHKRKIRASCEIKERDNHSFGSSLKFSFEKPNSRKAREDHSENSSESNDSMNYRMHAEKELSSIKKGASRPRLQTRDFSNVRKFSEFAQTDKSALIFLDMIGLSVQEKGQHISEGFQDWTCVSDQIDDCGLQVPKFLSQESSFQRDWCRMSPPNLNQKI